MAIVYKSLIAFGMSNEMFVVFFFNRKNITKTKNYILKIMYLVENVNRIRGKLIVNCTEPSNTVKYMF